jgi:hypothetical protein
MPVPEPLVNKEQCAEFPYFDLCLVWWENKKVHGRTLIDMARNKDQHVFLEPGLYSGKSRGYWFV